MTVLSLKLERTFAMSMMLWSWNGMTLICKQSLIIYWLPVHWIANDALICLICILIRRTRFWLNWATMHLSYLSFSIAFVQIELVLRTFNFFKIIYNWCIVLAHRSTLTNELMWKRLILTWLNALKLIALLLWKVVVVIC